MIRLPPLRSSARRLRDLLRPPGAVVISFPKSGRTQLRVMLHAARLEALFSHAGSSEARALEAHELTEALDYWQRHRVLFMIRDPRDTAVSAWFQARHRAEVYPGDLPGFLRDPRFGIEKILLFHLMWLEARERFPDFAVLRYESLQSEPDRAFRAAARFLAGVPPGDGRVARAVEAGRFGSMRRLEESGEGAALFGQALAPGRGGGPESYKTRRGVVGGWRDEFSGEDSAFAEALFREHDYWARLDRAGVPAA
ncbi:MAG TPA: sulfotransferase domain-containing protein [Allosphingosinicella sp.]|nr:sulfotransferase domain-containing protein [Allosphingosinicella sp.]